MQKENIKPLGENVLTKVIKNSTKTKSGIILPELVEGDRPQKGKIVAVSTSDKTSLRKGQVVTFSKYSGTEIKIGGEDHLIVKTEDILAIVE